MLRPAKWMPPLLVCAGLASGCSHPARSVSKASPFTPGLHTVTIGGSTIAYNVAGSGPVIFVHPGGPGLDWGYEKMPEVETFATVVYIEPIGTGHSSRTPGPRGYNLDRYAADVESLRTQLGLNKIILLGHSHGGFVAQTYAIAHNDHLKGLILYDTTPTTGPEWQKDVEAGMRQFQHEPWYSEATAALAQETSATTDSAMTAIFHREFPLYVADWTHHSKELSGYRDSTIAYVGPTKATDPSAKDQVGVAPSLEVRDKLNVITAPTLVIVGKRDFVTPEKWSRFIQGQIKGSRLVVLEHSGHMGHEEEPTAFAAAVQEFVNSLP